MVEILTPLIFFVRLYCSEFSNKKSYLPVVVVSGGSNHGHKGSKEEDDGNLHGDGDDDCKRMLDQLMLGDNDNLLYILAALVSVQWTFVGLGHLNSIPQV